MSDFQKCPMCFGEKHEKDTCDACGWSGEAVAEEPVHLKPGTVLQDKYIVGKTLGHGGFGITYLGWDQRLNIRLAIKEYFPRDLVSRSTDVAKVTVFSGSAQDVYQKGMTRFLEEARMLARFDDHPGIVSVRDYFQENETAYMVMTFLEGMTLKEYVTRQGGRLHWQQAETLIMPVMDALEMVHGAGLLHRDVSPDNIMITHAGEVKLIDFGAARNTVSEKSSSLSVVLKPGYAPEEQYRTRGMQGPWTDVYGVAATLYRLITGVVPPDALDRLHEELLRPPGAMGIDYPKAREQTLLDALAVHSKERIQSMKSFQERLVSLQEDLRGDPANDVHSNSGMVPGLTNKENSQGFPAYQRALWLSLSVVVLLVLGGIGWMALKNGDSPEIHWAQEEDPVVDDAMDQPIETGKEVTDEEIRGSAGEENHDSTVEWPAPPAWALPGYAEGIRTLHADAAMIDYRLRVMDGQGQMLWDRNWEGLMLSELEPVSDIQMTDQSVLVEVQGTLYAFERITGEEQWRVNGVGSIPIPYLDENGYVYATGYYGPFLTVIRPDGSVVFQHDTIRHQREEIYWPHDVFVRHGMIHVMFFGSETGLNCALFGVGSGKFLGLEKREDEAVTWDDVQASSALQPETGRYRPENVTDGDPNTAWVEGVDGPGAGEWIRLESGREHIVRAMVIEHGYQKWDGSSYDLFFQNNRPRLIQISFSDGTHVYATLPDSIGSEKIHFGRSIETRWVQVTILDVHPGTVYNDTCISGILVK